MKESMNYRVPTIRYPSTSLWKDGVERNSSTRDSYALPVGGREPAMALNGETGYRFSHPGEELRGTGAQNGGGGSLVPQSRLRPNG
jgi:hypothetical protein